RRRRETPPGRESAPRGSPRRAASSARRSRARSRRSPPARTPPRRTIRGRRRWRPPRRDRRWSTSRKAPESSGPRGREGSSVLFGSTSDVLGERLERTGPHVLAGAVEEDADVARRDAEELRDALVRSLLEEAERDHALLEPRHLADAALDAHEILRLL